MRKVICIIVFVLTLTSISIGQQKYNEAVFIELTYKIVGLEELTNYIQTEIFESRKAIFIKADTNFIGLGRETFDRESTPAIFIWHGKTLFFYYIDYWLKPIRVNIETDTSMYEFITCSQEKQKGRKYYKGVVTFTNTNGDWIITDKIIKEVKDICVTYNY